MALPKQRALQPNDLQSGRLRIDIDDKIHKLNIDKAPLMKIVSMLSKEKATQMKYEWLTKERRNDWITVSAAAASVAFGPADWSAGAATAGILSVTDAWNIGEGEILHVGYVNSVRVDINIYVQTVTITNPTTGEGDIDCRVVDGAATIDFSTLGTTKLLNMSNSFELGTGKGTLKSHQPIPNDNYIQIIQHPWGVVETMQHIENDAGGKEWDEMAEETMIQHEFAKEKTFFFGQKHLETVGLMDNTYNQYFTGGILEGITSIPNAAPAASIVTDPSLTQEDFGDWINSAIYYAEKPIIFASARIFEALSFWLGNTVETRQDETTLGISVSNYMTQYGETVKIIPHRELLKEDYNGWAFCVDMKDVKYKFLNGQDTHMEVGIQDNGEKKEINEIRTWFGAWLGNGKRHGVLQADAIA